MHASVGRASDREGTHAKTFRNDSSRSRGRVVPCRAARSGTDRPSDDRRNQSRGAQTISGVVALSCSDRRARTATHGITRSCRGRPLGARPVPRVDPREPASGGVRIRAWMVARKDHRRDDRAPLHAAHRVRRGLVTADEGNPHRRADLHRRQLGRRDRWASCRPARRDRPHASAADGVPARRPDATVNW